MSPPSIFTMLGHSVFCIILDAMRHSSVNSSVDESSVDRSRSDRRELGCPEKLLGLFMMNKTKPKQTTKKKTF